ncbi:MAG: carbohydrate ABC transporter permease [Thermoprotei archaeon]|nr:MAG: carbohydrate ABC transporter permease [Thermoprotei archaeon]RLE56722.1 MAG: carbohydrate ABC transporter permease [Thermoprotei archaeon]
MYPDRKTMKPLYTLIIAGCTSIISAFLGFFSGYGFARYRVDGPHLLFWILSIRFLPPVVAVIPYYLLFRALGILDTYPAVIIPHLCIGIPFAVWLMRSFIMSIPVELEEAALVDGCSRFTVLFKIVFPLALPGFLITVLFTFIWSWNEFMYALILTDVNVRVMTVTIAGMREAHGLMWGAVSAAATIATLPTIALAILLQKYLVSGLAFFTPRR